MTNIDLNADLGEGCEFDAALMGIVSSCNIACGGHAGDTQSMSATVDLAIANELAIGAHPGYPDRSGFGRRSRFLSGEELIESLLNQINSLDSLLRSAGRRLTHVKPHGALYNDAAGDPLLARAFVSLVQEVSSDAAITGPPQSQLEAAANAFGMTFIAEAFVDRAYLPDGSLVARSEPNAVHHDLNTMTTQAISLATDGVLTCETGELIKVRASTLCIHGDTENAAQIALAVRDALLASGVKIRAAH